MAGHLAHTFLNAPPEAQRQTHEGPMSRAHEAKGFRSFTNAPNNRRTLTLKTARRAHVRAKTNSGRSKQEAAGRPIPKVHLPLAQRMQRGNETTGPSGVVAIAEAIDPPITRHYTSHSTMREIDSKAHSLNGTLFSISAYSAHVRPSGTSHELTTPSASASSHWTVCSPGGGRQGWPIWVADRGDGVAGEYLLTILTHQTNQQINQPIDDRPTDRPTNRPTDRPTNRPTDRPTNQPTDLRSQSK